MIRCQRCDWTAVADPSDSRQLLSDHALTTGHPLCLICTRSLRRDEQQTCEKCLTDARSVLDQIVTMTAQLPRQLGQLRTTAFDDSRPAADGRPLPGGDALVLAGPGGVGNVSRYGEDYEPNPVTDPERWWLLDRLGPLTRAEWNAAERIRYGKEHLVDNRDADAPSVVWVLTQWAEDWTSTRRDLGFGVDPARALEVRMRDAARYLEVQTHWAATTHPAFDAYVEDLHALHARLSRVTGSSDQVRAAEAECFSCSGRLVRKVQAGKPCAHDLASLPPYPPGFVEHLVDGERVMVRVPVEELRAQHEQAIEVWESAHGRCQQQGGYADTWTCRRCGAAYSWERYTLALRARLADRPESGWSLPQHVAWLLGVPLQTVLTWAKRGAVATACLVGDRRMRVSYDDARERATRRQMRAS